MTLNIMGLFIKKAANLKSDFIFKLLPGIIAKHVQQLKGTMARSVIFYTIYFNLTTMYEFHILFKRYG